MYAHGIGRGVGRHAWTRLAGLWVALVVPFAALGQPANDMFANAQVIPADFTYGTIDATNYRATIEATEPGHSGVPSRRSIWYVWTPEFRGHARFQVNRSTMGLAVYTGSSLGSLQQVAMDPGVPPSHPVNFEAQPGVTYRIVIWSAASGDSGAAFTWSFHLETFSFIMPSEASGPLRTGWESRFAIQDSQGQLDIAEVEYRANGQPLGRAYAPPWEAVCTPEAAGGNAWQAVVRDTWGREHYSFPVTRLVYSGNDDFARAARVQPAAGFAEWTAVDTLASAEPGEPAHCGTPARRSLWWQWTPVCSGRATLFPYTKTENPSHLIRLAVYTGASLGNLQVVTQPAAENLVPVRFNATAGVTYRVASEGDVVKTNTYEIQLRHVTTEVFPARAERLVPGETILVEGTNHYSPALPLSFEWLEANNQSIGTRPQAPYRVPWTPASPGVYHLSAVATNEPGWATRSESTAFYVAPIHDAFARAETVAGPGRWVDAWAELATTEPGEPPHGGEPAEATLWWQWTPAVGGLATVTRETDNGQFAVYTGDSLTALVVVGDSHAGAGLPGHPPLQFMAEAGRTYRFALSRRAGSWQRDVVWALALDTFLFQSPGLGARFPQGAPIVLEVRENSPASLIKSVTLAAWAEAVLPEMCVTNILLSSGPFKATWVPEQPGVYVLTAAASRPDDSAGPVAPSRTVTVYPVNDAFSQAAGFLAADGGWRASGNTAGSSIEVSEAPMDQGGGSVWYQFEVPATAEFALSMTDGGNQNLKVSVFGGDQIGSLQLLAEAEAGQWCKFWGSAGQRLRLAVRGKRWALGTGFAYGGPFELRLVPLARHDRYELALPLALSDTGLGYLAADFGCTNEFATIEPAELRTEDFPWVATGPLSGTLWWQWTAPADGELWIEDVRWNGGWTRAGIFTGPDLDHLTDLAPSLSWAAFPQQTAVQRGVTYRVAVVGPDFLSYPHSRFDGKAYAVLLPGAPPANGQFATRQPLAGNSVVVSGSLLGSPQETVWYTWTAPTDGILTVTASSSSFTPVVGLFAGDAPDRLAPIPPDANATGSGIMDARVRAGAVVQIAISAPGRASFLEFPLTPFELRLSFVNPPRPANDQPTAPWGLTTADWRLDGKIDGAVADLVAAARGGARWWRWVAPTNGALVVQLLRSDMPTQVALYGPGLGGNEYYPFGFSTNPGFLVGAELSAGQVCLVAVSSPQRLLGGYSVQGAFLTASRNDRFADRTVVSGNPAAVGGYFGGATRESGEPVHHAAGRGQTLWWTWTAPTNGQLTLTCAQTRPLALAVYSGTTVANLTPVARGDSNGPLRFPVAKGAVCQIAAETLSDVAGFSVLNFDFRANPADAGHLSLNARWGDLIFWRLDALDGYDYRIEASDLASPWRLVYLISTQGGVTYFLDENAGSRPFQVYRVRLQE